MSTYYQEKALQAARNRFDSVYRQQNFLIRNLWKVITFGIFVSFLAPNARSGYRGFKKRTAYEISNLVYHELVIYTAIGYTLVCFLSHFIWKWQDKKYLKKLTKRVENLEIELAIAKENMQEEFIDILTKTGEHTGQSCAKSEIHRKGYYHNTAHIWLYTKEGHILLAQRSATKTICPSLWDVSVAGHVDAGEAIEAAAVREIFEEIGLRLSENALHKIGVFECFQSYSSSIEDNEFHHTFAAELKVPLSNLIKNVDEVDDLKLVDFNEFKTLLKHSETNQHFVASNSSYYMTVLEYIKEKVTQP